MQKIGNFCFIKFPNDWRHYSRRNIWDFIIYKRNPVIFKTLRRFNIFSWIKPSSSYFNSCFIWFSSFFNANLHAVSRFFDLIFRRQPFFYISSYSMPLKIFLIVLIKSLLCIWMKNLFIAIFIENIYLEKLNSNII